MTIEERVHYCEPEQGDILGEDDVEKRSIEDLISFLENEEKERLVGSLMRSLKSSDRQIDMLISKGDRCNVYISDILCVVTDLVNENRQDRVHMHVAKEANEEQKVTPALGVRANSITNGDMTHGS